MATSPHLCLCCHMASPWVCVITQPPHKVISHWIRARLLQRDLTFITSSAATPFPNQVAVTGLEVKPSHLSGGTVQHRTSCRVAWSGPCPRPGFVTQVPPLLTGVHRHTSDTESQGCGPERQGPSRLLCSRFLAKWLQRVRRGGAGWGAAYQAHRSPTADSRREPIAASSLSGHVLYTELP